MILVQTVPTVRERVEFQTLEDTRKDTQSTWRYAKWRTGQAINHHSRRRQRVWQRRVGTGRTWEPLREDPALVNRCSKKEVGKTGSGSWNKSGGGSLEVYGKSRADLA